jgi:hypothetical protein
MIKGNVLAVVNRALTFWNKSSGQALSAKVQICDVTLVVSQRYAKWSHDLTAQSEKVRKNLSAA